MTQSFYGGEESNIHQCSTEYYSNWIVHIISLSHRFFVGGVNRACMSLVIPPFHRINHDIIFCVYLCMMALLVGSSMYTLHAHDCERAMIHTGASKPVFYSSSQRVWKVDYLSEYSYCQTTYMSLVSHKLDFSLPPLPQRWVTVFIPVKETWSVRVTLRRCHTSTLPSTWRTSLRLARWTKSLVPCRTMYPP